MDQLIDSIETDKLGTHPASPFYIAPEHRQDWQGLVKALENRHGFQLYFIAVNDLTYRNRLLDWLDTELKRVGKEVTRIDLSSDDWAAGFESLENYLCEQIDSGSIVHLLNADLWLSTDNLLAFNVRRNALAEYISAQLIWWLPKGSIEKVARNAPDAWSWRAGVFDFLEVTPKLRPAVTFVPEQTYSGMGGAIRTERLVKLERILENDMRDDIRLPLLLETASALHADGQLDREYLLLRRAVRLAETLGDSLLRADATDRIAQILKIRGELDEALRIYRQEQLPAFEKLGESRARAVTMGRIADILVKQGELLEALRIRREQLPIFEQLDDQRGLAVTKIEIADVLSEQGRLDEAEKIWRETLPFFRQLNDVRTCACLLTRIGQALLKRGAHEEALSILREYALPIFELLGDAVSKLITRFDIALIVIARAAPGDLVEAQTLLITALQDAQDMGLPIQSQIADQLRDLEVQLLKKN